MLTTFFVLQRELSGAKTDEDEIEMMTDTQTALMLPVSHVPTHTSVSCTCIVKTVVQSFYGWPCQIFVADETYVHTFVYI